MKARKNKKQKEKQKEEKKMGDEIDYDFENACEVMEELFAGEELEGDYEL